MHNQNVNGVRRSVREGIVVDCDDKWPFLTAATDPTEGWRCAISIVLSLAFPRSNAGCFC
jgi:hypothetical protein